MAKAYLPFGASVHLERCIDWEASKLYCKKEDTRVRGPFEFGHERGQGARSDLYAAVETMKTDGYAAVAEQHPTVFVKFHRGLEALRDATAARPASFVKKLLFLYGPTGSGKSRMAYDLFPGVYRVASFTPLWMDGYAAQKEVLFDEMAVMDMPSRKDILALTDRHPLMAPRKGGFVHWMPSIVVMTSNFSPDELMGGCAPFMRRLAEFGMVVHMETLAQYDAHKAAIAAFVI